MPDYTLGDLVSQGWVQLSDGYRTKQSELGKTGIPILRVADIGSGFVSPSAKDLVRDEFLGAIGSKLTAPGDVVITTKGTVGRVAQIPEGFPRHVYSPQACFVRVVDKGKLDSGWLKQWFSSRYFALQAARLMHSTDMAPYLSLRDMRGIEISVPPLDEQMRVATVLGTLDSLIDTQLKIANTAVELARSILRMAATGKAYQLAACFSVIRGTSYASEDFSQSSGIRSVSMGAVTRGGWINREKMRLLDKPIKDKYLLGPFDLVMPNVDLTWDLNILAWPGLIPFDLAPVAATSDLFILRPVAGFEDQRLAAWAQLSDARQRAHLEGCAKGTTVASISPTDVGAVEIRAVEDRASIDAAAALVTLAWNAELARSNLKTTRMELLQLLLSGKARAGQFAA